jgi:signal transduction histidine kinase
MAAIVSATLSFVEFSTVESLDREVDLLETRIHNRQEVLESYVTRVLEMPDDEFVTFDDFPDDMVIYRYFDDTLQSWVNRFPIANDDIDFFPFAYRINHLNSRVVTNTPLAYLRFGEQYVNLGSAWYVVKVYVDRNQTIISALLIQTEYPTENNILENKINPNFSLSKQLDIVPVTYDESYLVRGREGGVLFTVLKRLPVRAGEMGTMLRWISILLVISALVSNLLSRRSVRDYIAFVAGLFLVRMAALFQAAELQGESELFSPALFADSGIFSSLGELLINNVAIVLFVLSVFVVRRHIYRIAFGKTLFLRIVTALVVVAIPLLLLPYIHYTIHSLVVNSGIVLEPFKIDEISIYTVMVYISYSLLFTSLVLSLQLLRPLVPGLRKVEFLGRRSLMVYISLISLYTLLAVSYYGFRKEFNENRVWTTKMSVERDLNLELQLLSLEKFIERDPAIASLVTVSQDIEVINNNLEIINNRLTEAYFWNVLQRYDMRLYVCLPNTVRVDDISIAQSPAQHCNNFYENEINRYGMPLGERSGFFFMNNYNGRISYLGAFVFYRYDTEFRLYIELDSKFIKESIGYPGLLMDNKSMDGFNLPPGYSYGKYLNGRLVSYGGDFNYPIKVSQEYEPGYYTERSEGYIHFIHKISGENHMVMSRPERSLLPYVVSFSYLVLFYSFFILGLFQIRKVNILYNVPRNSFRWKIMMLIISALVVALFALGAGSVWVSVRFFNQNVFSQMEEKMNSVQTTLSYRSKYVNRYNDQRFNNLALMETMNRLSNTAQVDINVYTPEGMLLRTTRSEIFDSYLLGTRMDPEAYNEIVYNNKKQFINRERLGNLDYYSLYAPLFNVDGKLIAIVNIPYFSRENSFRSDASSIIAAIINIYLLLMIGAVFVGIALSNSIARPLIEISRKMQLLDISEQPEHIDYNHRDELGILVAAYNKMVDDVDESTKRLAQSEREQAWREMARQIAHEIKNPLTPMRLSIQHMMRLKERDVPDWNKKFDTLAKSLIEQIDILSEAAGEFSSFSRFYYEKQARFDLITLIREQIVLFNTRDNVSISMKTSVKSASVYSRKGQITRVLVNLLSNAVQALEKNKEGKILVSLGRDAEFWKMTIDDSGAGVPEDLRYRLFKPNFTTKSGGTGLGLAICRSIMEQSGGTIHYEKSSMLGGASFVVRIPVVEDEG